MANIQPSTAAPITQTPLSDSYLCHFAAGFIQYWEGFEPEAKWDVNAYRLGYGSDTEGPQQIAVTKGMTTTPVLALANLAARVPQYEAECIKQLGALWPKLGTCTKVACLDMAYNYGAIPANVVSAFLLDGNAVADAIRRHDADNTSINRDRRAAEAGLVIYDGGQTQ